MSLPLRRKTSEFLRHVPWIMAATYPLVRFLQPRHTIGVVGAVFNDKQEILLVEHVFHPNHPWGLPGGWVARNEAPAQAVKREFFEELTLSIEIEAVVAAETTYRNHLDLAYLCNMKSDIGNINFELLNYGWFGVDQLPEVNQFTRKAIQQAFELLIVLESR